MVHARRLLTFKRESVVANNTNTITMSMRELDRLKVVEAVVEGRLMPQRTAEQLIIRRTSAGGNAGLSSVTLPATATTR
ncbi:hypothetical protein DF151_32540 [Burkholderia ubonensis]|nr:hypothetical protein DF144_28055 [Burkholderia ubonensis]RQP49794.1 hypothetical protein DF151_32540 [Burkholderia ubonensis]